MNDASIIHTENAAALMDVAAIGNGRVAALVDSRARIVWWCFPRFDADPVFSRLLSGGVEKGFSDIVMQRMSSVTSGYIRNTALLETIMTDEDGNSARIVDFMPRMRRFERIYHPPTLFRRIEPVRGIPRITIRVRPTFGYGGAIAGLSVGSNHIRYVGSEQTLRLSTDAPLSYIKQETPFALTQPLSLAFGADEPIDGALDLTTRDLMERTISYWHEWVRTLGVPLEWQQHVIRAAITLKMCSFDETGAIIAALTTSIPEAPNTARTWDYRYCWPRDAHFVIKALNQLGATQTMESYLRYISSISVNTDEMMRPVYGIVHDQPLAEVIASDLLGFAGHGPVRIGNSAAEQPQHDTYGSIILGASQMFVDERLPRMGDAALFAHLEPLGHRARQFAKQPDAGPWEYRGRRQIHTYSATMCWVACDRLARIAARLGLAERMHFWRAEADAIRSEILARSFSERRNAFVASYDGVDLDAITLLLPELGLVDVHDPRYVATVDAIGRDLVKNGYVLRYTAPDDFGVPDMAFLACQFWYIDALHRLGRHEESRELFAAVLARRNSFGLLSEDIDPVTGQLWGNLPQTYSMAGIINTAMALSRGWEYAWTGPGTT
jgi:GH15 family glucan-1,4-alpha-glucosidase